MKENLKYDVNNPELIGEFLYGFFEVERGEDYYAGMSNGIIISVEESFKYILPLELNEYDVNNPNIEKVEDVFLSYWYSNKPWNKDIPEERQKEISSAFRQGFKNVLDMIGSVN